MDPLTFGADLAGPPPRSCCILPAVMGAMSAVGGMMGGGGDEGGGAPPNAQTQTFTNKAKGGKNVSNLTLFEDNSKGKDKAAGEGGGDMAEAASLFSTGGLSPELVLAAMVFILVLIAIIALLGR